MILKVKLLEENFPKNPSENYDCWVFDDIDRINYRIRALKSSTCSDLSNIITITNPIKKTKEEYLKIIVRHLNPNKKPTILFLQDCVCYLCNNEGKTFDKLVC